MNTMSHIPTIPSMHNVVKFLPSDLTDGIDVLHFLSAKDLRKAQLPMLCMWSRATPSSKPQRRLLHHWPQRNTETELHGVQRLVWSSALHNGYIYIYIYLLHISVVNFEMLMLMRNSWSLSRQLAAQERKVSWKTTGFPMESIRSQILWLLGLSAFSRQAQKQPFQLQQFPPVSEFQSSNFNNRQEKKGKVPKSWWKLLMKYTPDWLHFLPKSWKSKMGPSNSSFLSNIAIFHFHDYGRKSNPSFSDAKVHANHGFPAFPLKL